LIPAGTGLAYHKDRQAKAESNAASDTVSAEEIEVALTEALKSSE